MRREREGLNIVLRYQPTKGRAEVRTPQTQQEYHIDLSPFTFPLAPPHTPNPSHSHTHSRKPTPPHHTYHHMVCQPTKAYAAKTSCEYQTSATRELSSKATTDPYTPLSLYTTTHFHTLAHSPLSIPLSSISHREM